MNFFDKKNKKRNQTVLAVVSIVVILGMLSTGIAAFILGK